MATNQQQVLVRLSAEGEEEVVSAFRRMAEGGKSAGKAVSEGMEEAGKGLGSFINLTTRARSELIVLAHEALQGRFSRIPGSVMVLAESLGSVGEAFLGLLGPMALVAGAVAVAGKAFADGAHEVNAMNAALGLTGDYAGQTIGTMRMLASEVSKSTTLTIGQSKELITQIVASGQISAGAVQKVADLTGLYAQKTGEDVDKLGPQLIRMFEDPTKAAEDLNKTMHFLTAAQMEHIRVLQQTNDVQGAQIALADALTQHLQGVQHEVGLLSRAWLGIKKTASEAWDAMSGIGRSDTPEERLRTVNNRLADLARNGFSQGRTQQLLLQERDQLQQKVAAGAQRAAQEQAQAEQIRKESVADSIIQTNSYLAQIQRLRGEIEKLSQVKFSDPAQESQRQDAIKAIDDQIRRIETRGERFDKKDSREAYQMRLVESQLQQQLLENDLQSFKEKGVAAENLYKEAYDQGLISLKQYFDARRQIVNSEAEKEAQTLRDKAKAADIAGDPNDPKTGIQRKIAEAKLAGELAKQQEKQQAALTKLDDEEAQADQRNTEQRIRSQERLLAIQGKRYEAQKLQLQDSLRQLDRELRAGGVSDADRADALSTAGAQGRATIEYEQQLQKVKDALKQVDDEIKLIKQEQADGKLFPIQAEQQIVELEKKRYENLKLLADQLEKLAQETGNDAFKTQAEQIRVQVQGIGAAGDEAGKQLASVKQSLQGALGSELDKFLTSGIMKSKSLGDAFRGMALGIINDIESMAAKALEKQFMKYLFGDGSGGAGGGVASGALSSFASLFSGFATGGYVSGPGTNKSDSVPAMLSNGEFVIHADAVGRPGMRQLLEAINGNTIRGGSHPSGVAHYAAGGFVSGGPGSGGGVKIVNVPDASLLGAHLDSSTGEQQIINIISKNPQRVRAALG